MSGLAPALSFAIASGVTEVLKTGMAVGGAIVTTDMQRDLLKIQGDNQKTLAQKELEVQRLIHAAALEQQQRGIDFEKGGGKIGGVVGAVSRSPLVWAGFGLLALSVIFTMRR